MKSYYNYRNHIGQFYARAQYLKNQTRARTAIAYFITAAILSALWESLSAI